MRNHATQNWRLRVLPLLAAAALGAPLLFADDGRQLSVTVETIERAVQPDPPGDMDQEEPPQPTMPRGKLPQYQLTHRDRVLPTAAQIADPRLRLILVLPHGTDPSQRNEPLQTVLIEAVITIDGRPFRTMREQRIAEILKEARQPQASTVEPANNEPVEENGAHEDDQNIENAEQEQGDSAEPPSVGAYSLPATVAERIRRQIAATGEVPSVEEMRWILTHWVDGPTLLMLNDNFQRFRANQRPVFDVLDRNHDGIVSADELDTAVIAFKNCDRNGNDIVDYSELDKATPPQLRQPEQDGHKLLYRIPADIRETSLLKRMSVTDEGAASILSRFDANADRQLDEAELRDLGQTSPDLTFHVSFDSTSPEKSRVTLVSVRDELAEVVSETRIEAGAIIVTIGQTNVAFSGVQSARSDQVSVGAVKDGYPLLSLVDPNDDGRFTLRELRSLVDRLRSFDRNEDGRLTANESEATVRICFGMGPHVHRVLAELRDVDRGPQTPPVVGPRWFVSLDVNKDNDLTRKEFPGTDEQFAKIDTDSDELISAQEAVAFDAKSNPTTPQAESGTTE